MSFPQLEAPVEVFDGIKWYWSAAAAAYGITGIVAGEWGYNTLIFAKKVTPWTSTNTFASRLTGAVASFNAALLPFTDPYNVKQQKLMGVGYAALAGVCSIGYWKSLNFFGKAAVVQYIATAVFQFLFKPKAKTTTAKPAAATATTKK